MSALQFPRPAVLHTRRLEAELAAAGIPARSAVVDGAALIVEGPALNDQQRAAVQAVLDAHTGATEEDRELSFVTTDGDKSSGLPPLTPLAALPSGNAVAVLAKLNELISAYNKLVERYNTDIVGLKHCWLDVPK